MSQTDRSCPLSSPGCPESKTVSKKPIKPPTITPRRFKKFFTPAKLSKYERNVRTSRRALQDITNPPVNPKHSLQLSRWISHSEDLENATPFVKEARGSKRKLSFASIESCSLLSPLGPDPFFLSSSPDICEGSVCDREWPTNSNTIQQESDQESVAEDEDEIVIGRNRKNAVRPFRTRSRSSTILFNRLSGRGRRQETHSSKLWQYETATFYSNAKDAYFCGSQAYGRPALPFSSASCNTNSLVAVGDEEGGIQLLDSASNVMHGFSKPYLTFKPHDNAIMDLDFADDDRLLVTGSGDQTCRVIDMLTQETVHTLSGHSSSIKRVHFQPGSRNSIVASCSRDGNVNIWDLRTRSVDRPAQQLCSASTKGTDDRPAGFNMPAVSLRDKIRAAHSDRDDSRKATAPKSKSNHRRVEASVTCFLFLGGGREHLLATSSEADATVKLWDMRTTYDTRRARPLPLSTTRQPDGHEKHRHFGLTSMALSTDGARLYTLCRDHTIYAYSTAHLILDSAPELTTTSLRPRRAGGSEREGLGPLYGFRHQQLRASTFYVKLSVRKQKDDKTELLAAGSGDDCAILFPTNERYLGCNFSATLDYGRPSLRRLDFGSEALLPIDGGVPIYRHGTALVRGHQKEVTAVTWSNDGHLVTVSDDFHVRCWREGGEARDLQTGGEGQGKRWMCGWADVDRSHNDEE